MQFVITNENLEFLPGDQQPVVVTLRTQDIPEGLELCRAFLGRVLGTDVLKRFQPTKSPNDSNTFL